MRLRYLLLAAIALLFAAPHARAACTPTGFYRDNINMTAALINPPDTVTGVLDASGCNIGVYFNIGVGKIEQAEIFGANYFGVLVNGDVNVVSVDILDSSIHDIGETPLNGAQHGVAIYYRSFSVSGSASGTVSGDTIYNYQKGGIVANGQGTSTVITDNTVTGEGHISFIAQNGIQVGYGASASVMRNSVFGNSYTGAGWASGGILVVGGPGYGDVYTVGTRIVGNILSENDVGVWLSNLDANDAPPTTATNIKVVNNIISSDGLENGYRYQAGVSDVGNNDKIVNNNISGPGYDSTNDCECLFPVDADTSFTNRPKVHANSFDGVKTN